MLPGTALIQMNGKQWDQNELEDAFQIKGMEIQNLKSKQTKQKELPFSQIKYAC